MPRDKDAFDAFYYRYRARVVEVHDGDTIVADLDLGFGIGWLRRLVRFAGVNAAEINSKVPAEKARGQQAKALVAGLCPPGDYVMLATHLEVEAPPKARRKSFTPELEKYGRVFADVFWAVGRPSAGAELVRAKLGRRWDGTGPKPWEEPPA